MTHENQPPSHSLPHRTFRLGGLVAAIVASAIVAAGGTLLIVGRGGSAPHEHGSGVAAPAKEQWQCPMHPSIIRDQPGDCPICGMKLVKMVAAGGAAGAAKAESRPAEKQPDKW